MGHALDKCQEATEAEDEETQVQEAHEEDEAAATEVGSSIIDTCDGV